MRMAISSCYANEEERKKGETKMERSQSFSVCNVSSHSQLRRRKPVPQFVRLLIFYTSIIFGVFAVQIGNAIQKSSSFG